ncbi:hypothetical protein ISCGN_018956 [Ixodes scapularis]
MLPSTAQRQRGTNPYRSEYGASTLDMASCRQSTLVRQDTQRNLRVRGPRAELPTMVPISPIVGTMPEFQQTIDSDSWNQLPSNGSPSQEAAEANEEATTEKSCKVSRLEELQVSLLQSKRVYRHRLRSRLICAFCVFLVVGAVACVTTAALLTRHDSPRGALLAMEGVLELLPENPAYCPRGSHQAITAFSAEVFNAVEDRMDAVFGNVSTASSYSGALVENIACLARRGGVRVQIDFLASMEEPSEPPWHPARYSGPQGAGQSLRGVPGRQQQFHIQVSSGRGDADYRGVSKDR